jgi:hypothetical protein
VFVLGKPFELTLMFVSKAGANRVKPLSRARLKGRLLALPANIRLGWKRLVGGETLGATTISITTFSLTTLSITIFCITTLSITFK